MVVKILTLLAADCNKQQELHLEKMPSTLATKKNKEFKLNLL
jgi:hypothetical protein